MISYFVFVYKLPDAPSLHAFFGYITMNSGASCSHSSTPQGRPAIGNEPNQPSGFHFPMREFGIKTVVKRAFNPKWFTKCPWLHYSS